MILGTLGLWRNHPCGSHPEIAGRRERTAQNQGAELVQDRPRNDIKGPRFHQVVDGEIVVADGSAVLEMVLDGSVGMVIYDRTRRLAAASKLRLGSDGGSSASIRERTSSASLALLTRLAARGCKLECLEVFALGAVDATTLGTGPAGQRLRRVSLAIGLPETPGARRVEFDVALGRIVVEEYCPTRT
jgi:hypothetical protein